MTHTCEFDARQNRVVITVTPPISESDAQTCLRGVRAHPDFRAGCAILINLLAAERSLSTSEAESVGAVMGYFFPGHRIALVRPACVPVSSYDACRAVASSKADVRVFEKLESAKAWLEQRANRTDSRVHGAVGLAG